MKVTTAITRIIEDMMTRKLWRISSGDISIAKGGLHLIHPATFTIPSMASFFGPSAPVHSTIANCQVDLLTSFFSPFQLVLE
jgi:hypothetical protein